MPVWGWILLIGVLSALAVAAVAAIVHRTHRMRSEEPLHGDPENIAAPLPLDVSAADSQTSREAQAERSRDPSLR